MTILDTGSLLILATQAVGMGSSPTDRISGFRAAADWLRASPLGGSDDAAAAADGVADELATAVAVAEQGAQRAADENELAALGQVKAELEAQLATITASEAALQSRLGQ